MSDAITNETIAREFYTQYRARNREALEALMHPDFEFSSPHDDHINRKAYFDKCWKQGDRMKNLTVENVAVTNQYVFVEYKGIWSDGQHWRDVDIFKIEDGKVRHIRVYFGDAEKAEERPATQKEEAPASQYRPSLLAAIGF